MQLVVVGTHQRKAAIKVRECLAFGEVDIGEALHALHAYTAEGMIISTCNRVEICAMVAGDEPGDLAVQRFLADWHHMAIEQLLPHLYTFNGDDAVRHMFRLASGLDSMVLGEDQIMGQLKGALAAGNTAGTIGPLLHRMINSALAAGKGVRTHTGIARSPVSVVSVALGIARSMLGGLTGKRVLIVGAGQMASLALKHLRDDAPRSIGIAARTPERASTLAAPYNAQVWPLSQLAEALGQADVVLSCTAAPNVVVTADDVAQALGGRSEPLLLFDLAVPHDVDRQVKALDGAQLFDVDDLQAICLTNREARAAEVTRAEALVEEEVTRFMTWWATQEVVPTIRALRAQAEAIREAELARTLAKLPDLSPQARQAIQALSSAIVNKLLHQPITNLKDPAAGSLLAPAAKQLFHLSDLNTL